MAKYRCPQCGIIADIDTTNLIKKIVFPPGSRQGLTFPKPGHVCELAKAILVIDFSKLEAV